MDESKNNEFYRSKAWDLLLIEIREIKSAQTAQSKDIADIKSKVNYMYGFAAAIGISASLVVEWVRGKLGGH